MKRQSKVSKKSRLQESLLSTCVTKCAQDYKEATGFASSFQQLRCMTSPGTMIAEHYSSVSLEMEQNTIQYYRKHRPLTSLHSQCNQTELCLPQTLPKIPLCFIFDLSNFLLICSQNLTFVPSFEKTIQEPIVIVNLNQTFPIFIRIFMIM